MSRWAAALYGIALAFLAPTLAAAADTARPSHPISIPQQALGSALQALARQSGTQIIFFSQVTEGREAPALSGTFTAEEALQTLLSETGLTFQSLNDRTIEVLAQTRPMPVSELQGADRISEVEISAQREKLWRMRAEMASIEGRFFEEYNALNTDDDFDIHCNLSPGKRLRFGDARSICRPAFVESAIVAIGGGGGRGGSADAGLWGIPGGLLSGSAVGSYYGGFGFDQSAKWTAYEKHVLALINRHPQLRKIVSDREALEKRYEQIRREKLKRNIFIQ